MIRPGPDSRKKILRPLAILKTMVSLVQLESIDLRYFLLKLAHETVMIPPENNTIERIAQQ